jgi:UPF0755 protein
MNDILPPKRPLSASPPPPRITAPAPKPVLLKQAPVKPLLAMPKKRLKKIWLWVVGGLVVALLLAVGSAFAWYKIQLSPVSGKADAVRVQIVDGSSPAQIGELLEESKVIRSRIAFDVYTRQIGVQGKLQAGAYRLSPAKSTEQIVDQLIAGDTDQFAITFLPGATLTENRAGLIKAGFSAAAVDAALTKTYDHPLFADKPASADLEGYMYGETYHFEGEASVEQILIRTFDEFYDVIKKNNLVESFKAHNLSLYQGITLASIIQREVANPADQKQVAQIFYKRLNEDISLGADATFVYAAKKLGVTPSVNLDSPYNTRIHTGLPPGPIAAPGLSALQATAQPATGDYLYFVSGDDGVTYFARTQEEHEANTAQYCHVNCGLF